MINKVVVSILVIICLVVVGCFETEKMLSDGVKVTGDTNKIEIVDYNWTTMNEREEVVVTVKNIAGYTLDFIWVTTTFYDSDDNELCSEIGVIKSIPNSYTKKISIHLISCQYFECIDHISFCVSDNMWGCGRYP